MTMILTKCGFFCISISNSLLDISERSTVFVPLSDVSSKNDLFVKGKLYGFPFSATKFYFADKNVSDSCSDPDSPEKREGMPLEIDFWNNLKNGLVKASSAAGGSRVKGDCIVHLRMPKTVRKTLISLCSCWLVADRGLHCT